VYLHMVKSQDPKTVVWGVPGTILGVRGAIWGPPVRGAFWGPPVRGAFWGGPLERAGFFALLSLIR